MVYINTYHYEKDRTKYKNNIEDLFKTTVMNEELDNRDIEIIKYIDDAIYIGNNTIKNFLGQITSIENLSRGVKTLLIIRWFIKQKKENLYFDISSCGNNIFDLLMDEVENVDIHLLTCNYTIINGKKAEIIVNDKYKINYLSELADLGGKLYEHCN